MERSVAASQCWGCFHAAHLASRCAGSPTAPRACPCDYGPVVDVYASETSVVADRCAAAAALILNGHVVVDSRLVTDELVDASTRSEWRARVALGRDAGGFVSHVSSRFRGSIEEALDELRTAIVDDATPAALR